MKTFAVLLPLLLCAGCSAEQAEEFAFRKTMEYQLIDECGDGDEDCVKAVKEQIESCMQQSDWRKYLDNENDETEMKRFIDQFFPCFKDADGNSYFHVN